MGKADPKPMGALMLTIIYKMIERRMQDNIKSFEEFYQMMNRCAHELIDCATEPASERPQKTDNTGLKALLNGEDAPMRLISTSADFLVISVYALLMEEFEAQYMTDFDTFKEMYIAKLHKHRDEAFTKMEVSSNNEQSH